MVSAVGPCGVICSTPARATMRPADREPDHRHHSDARHPRTASQHGRQHSRPASAQSEECVRACERVTRTASPGCPHTGRQPSDRALPEERHGPAGPLRTPGVWGPFRGPPVLRMSALSSTMPRSIVRAACASSRAVTTGTSGLSASWRSRSISRRMARIRSPSWPAERAVHDAGPVVVAGGPAIDGRHEPRLDADRHAQVPRALGLEHGVGDADQVARSCA